MAVLDDVVFAYVKLQNPVKSMNEGDTEFSVTAFIEKSEVKAWNKANPKNKCKEVDNDDFEEKYKFEPPFEDQDSQYYIAFKKVATKKGKDMPEQYRPRAFQKVKGKNVDITFDKLIGNGSKGKVQYSTFTSDFGTFVQLVSILVEDMIEYELPEREAEVKPGSEFGEVELAPVPESAKKAVQKQGEAEDEDEPKKSVKTPAAKADVKPGKPKKKPDFSDMDDDIPF